MGATRTELDDAIYAKRRAYYLANRERLIATSKARYQLIKDTIKRKNKEQTEALRQQRLETKRRALYGDSIPKEPWERVIDRNKAYIKAYKEGKPCHDCGQTYPYYIMDLDHVSGEKKADISTLVHKGKSIKKIKEELLKCDLVCANCHRTRTYNRIKPIF